MTTLGLVLALLLVLLNGFFVAAEFALVKVRSTQLQARADQGSSVARLALQASKHLDAYLSATQLGITLASIGLGWVGEPAVSSILEPLLHSTGIKEEVVEGISMGIAFTLVSMFHIVLGELAPKSWAIQKSESLSLLIIRPLHWFYILFRPVIAGMNFLAALILRPFGINAAGGHEVAHSEDELRMLVVASGEQGVLNETEVEIAGHVLGFADKNVGDIMIPRVDMVVLDVTHPFQENIALALSQPFSRYPLVNGDHDDILGVVHVKDLFSIDALGEEDIRRICREVPRVPITKPLDLMLRDFQRERVHMAVVQDEYGGTAGIVTLENVIEEIVGEIADESDPAEGDLRRIGESQWRVSGSSRLTKIHEQLGLKLESEEHETISGYLFERLGRVPRIGDTLVVEDTTLTVEDADSRRARRILVHLKTSPRIRSSAEP